MATPSDLVFFIHSLNNLTISAELDHALLCTMQCLARAMKALLTVWILSAVAAAGAERLELHAASCPPLECHPSGPSFDYFKLVRCATYATCT